MPSTHPTFQLIIKNTKSYADSFLSVVKQYTPPDKSLAEQFDRDTLAGHGVAPVPKSARDLTWSYAALLTGVDARRGVVGAGSANGVVKLSDKENGKDDKPKVIREEGWGAKGLKMSYNCAESPKAGEKEEGFVRVTFNVKAETRLGGKTSFILFVKPCCEKLMLFSGVTEDIYIAGSGDALKNWSETDAIIMSSERYPIWSGTSHSQPRYPPLTSF
jgi:glucoamylase